MVHGVLNKIPTLEHIQEVLSAHNFRVLLHSNNLESLSEIDYFSCTIKFVHDGE